MIAPRSWQALRAALLAAAMIPTPAPANTRPGLAAPPDYLLCFWRKEITRAEFPVDLDAILDDLFPAVPAPATPRREVASPLPCYVRPAGGARPL